jgi:hypothetical protein
MSETDRASAQRQGEALTVRLPSTWTFGLAIVAALSTSDCMSCTRGTERTLQRPSLLSQRSLS